MKPAPLLSIYIGTILALLGTSTAHGQLSPPPQDHLLSFDGDEIALAPVSTTLNLGASFTMEAWVFMKVAEPYAVILGKPHNPRDQDPWMDYTIGLDDTGERIEFQMSTGTPGSYTSARSESSHKGQWTHVAAVHDGSDMMLVIDGHAVATVPSPGPPDNTSLPFGIGAGAQQDGSIIGGFNGFLAQVRVWNRALEPAELAQMAGTALTGSETGLLAYWPLDDGSGDTARDLGPAGQHLQLGTQVGTDARNPTWLSVELMENPVFESTIYATPGGYTAGSWLRLIDFDTDGDLDAVMTQIKWPASYPDPNNMPLIAMRNENGDFVDRTAEVFGGATSVHARAFAIADFNGDTLADLFMADHGTDIPPFPGEQNSLFLQTDGGTLQNASRSHLPIQSEFTHSAAAADVDGDGDVDIYAGDMNKSPKLLLNDGRGYFVSETERFPAFVRQMQEIYLSAAFADVDKDGDYDLILGDEGGTYNPPVFPDDTLLLNDGNGFFERSAEGAMPHRTGGTDHTTIFVAPSDFDGDGWPDLMLANMRHDYSTPSLQLLINNGDGTFRDETERISQSWPESNDAYDWLEEIYPADFNGDGWMDVLVGSGSRGSHLFLNQGDANFVDASEALTLTLGARLYPGDLDGDHDVDIFGVMQDSIPAVLWNRRIYMPAATPLSTPGTPSLTMPASGESVSSQVQLEWSDVIASTHYEIELAVDADFNEVVRRIPERTPSQIALQLQSSHTYYWRVRAVNTAGPGAWSGTGQFVVGSGVRNDETFRDAEIPFALHPAFPNPSTGAVSIPFDTATFAHVRISIFDTLGRQVAVLVDDPRQIGRHVAVWDTDGHANGIYLYRLEAGAFVRTGQISIAR